MALGRGRGENSIRFLFALSSLDCFLAFVKFEVRGSCRSLGDPRSAEEMARESGHAGLPVSGDVPKFSC